MQKNLFFLERYSALLGVQQITTAFRTPHLVKFLAYQSQHKKFFLKQIHALYHLMQKKKDFANQKHLSVHHKKSLFMQKKKYTRQGKFLW
jgi:hypothetical protein